MRFSLPYSSRDAIDLGGKWTRNISPFSVHAWLHFTVITDNLWHRNSWNFDRQMKRVALRKFVSMCRESVWPQPKVHSLNISVVIDIWHRQHREFQTKSKSLFMISNRACDFFTFFFFFSSARLLHFITTSFLFSTKISNAIKTAQLVNWVFLACRATNDDDDVLVESSQSCCCGCKKFNYIIDDRWRLWHYRKWKHDDAWYHWTCVCSGISWQQQQQWTCLSAAAAVESKSERNAKEVNLKSASGSEIWIN